MRIISTSERPSRIFAGTPGPVRRRDHHVVGHHGIGADGRTRADDGPVQHDAAGAGQRLVLERAALQMGQMADHAAVADHGREARARVDDRAVLNGRATPTVIVP